MKPLILCLLLVCTVSVFAQSSDRDTEKDALCEKWNSAPLPADASGIPEPKSFPRCDSYKLYSGIGGKVDFVATRKCAWSERLAMEAGLRQASGDPIPWAIGGSIILTELYANGEGVQKNVPLALRLACEANGDEGEELEDLVKRMEQSTATKFRYCDHAFDTFTMNFCASYDAEIGDQERSDLLKHLSSNWTQTQRDALARLTKSEIAYAKAHEIGEINTGGTIRDLNAIGAYNEVRGDFVEALKSFEKGRLPNDSAKNAADADVELNRIFRKAIAMAKVQNPDYGPPEPERIRAAERAWISYRDMWVEFAKIRYPTTSSESWLALLTQDRIAVLNQTLCQIGELEGQDDPSLTKCEDVLKGDASLAGPLP
jgi:hypothetical protein